MASPMKTKRTCPNGHTYFKTTDCPTCPKCEATKAPATGFMSELSAPARRALERNGITTLYVLKGYSEKELLRLHGLGPGTIPTLKRALKGAGLALKK